MTSPKTCPVCKILNLRDYRGDWIPTRFPYHWHVSVNKIRASVHRYCRCLLRWAGRAKEIYESPFGLLNRKEIRQLWTPEEKELEELTPSQLKYVLKFLRKPWET